MEKLVIHHAYDGFLYAPLFLADMLGLFPRNCKLKCDGDDAESVQKLCDNVQPGEKHWFAICDPLCKQSELAIPRGGHEERLCLVGSFITSAPVWLYNTNPKIGPLSEEADLEKHSQRITRIVTYPHETTGHLFGERIRKKFIPSATIVTNPFGREFDGIDDGTLVVSSDVLRVLKEDKDDQLRNISQRKNPIIFRYPERGPDIAKQFLFTGILTLRVSVLKENLDVLLGVMGAIQKGIHFLSRDSVDTEHVKLLVKRFKQELTKLGYTTPLSCESHIRDALCHIRDLRLYHASLEPEAISFVNAENEWSILRSGPARDTKAFIQRIPTLLLRPSRFQNGELLAAVIDRAAQTEVEKSPVVKKIIDDFISKPEGFTEAMNKVDDSQLKNSPRIQQMLYQIPSSSRVDRLVAIGAAFVPIFSAYCVYGLVDRMRRFGEAFSKEWFAYSFAFLILLSILVLNIVVTLAFFDRNVKRLKWLLGVYYSVLIIGGVIGAVQLLPINGNQAIENGDTVGLTR